MLSFANLAISSSRATTANVDFQGDWKQNIENIHSQWKHHRATTSTLLTLLSMKNVLLVNMHKEQDTCLVTSQ